MTDQSTDKTPLEIWKDVSSSIKEMAHYSEANIEKLAALWLAFDADKKLKELADLTNATLRAQNAFQEKITALIEKHDQEGAKLAG